MTKAELHTAYRRVFGARLKNPSPQTWVERLGNFIVGIGLKLSEPPSGLARDQAIVLSNIAKEGRILSSNNITSDPIAMAYHKGKNDFATYILNCVMYDYELVATEIQKVKKETKGV